MATNEERYQFLRKNFSRLIVSVEETESGKVKVSRIEISETLSTPIPASVDHEIDEAIERGDG